MPTWALLVAQFGRAVTFITSGAWFESCHRQLLFTVNCLEKKNIKKKRPRMA